MICVNRETDWLLPTTETGTENGVKPKKRRKETVADGKSLEGSANYNNVLREDKVKQNEVGSAKSGNDHSIRSELVQKCSDIRRVFSLPNFLRMFRSNPYPFYSYR